MPKVRIGSISDNDGCEISLTGRSELGGGGVLKIEFTLNID